MNSKIILIYYTQRKTLYLFIIANQKQKNEEIDFMDDQFDEFQQRKNSPWYFYMVFQTKKKTFFPSVFGINFVWFELFNFLYTMYIHRTSSIQPWTEYSVFGHHFRDIDISNHQTAKKKVNAFTNNPFKDIIFSMFSTMFYFSQIDHPDSESFRFYLFYSNNTFQLKQFCY